MPRWLMLVGVLLVAALGLVYFQSHDIPTLGVAKQSINQTINKQSVPKQVAIIYNNHAFNPPSAQITLGQTVIFENQSANPVWIASDPYPTHADLPALNSGKQIAPGQSYSFTFPRAGTFSYHNELTPAEHAKVTITEAP